jgi:tRNA(fMet)-specific endonuclease VapC
VETLRITEAELARDIHATLAKVQEGVEVVVEQDHRAVATSKPAKRPGRSISAVTVAGLVHGVARANTPEIRDRLRASIDELKRHVPVHPVTGDTAEIAGQLSGEQAAEGITIPADDLLIGASALEQGYAVVTLNARHFQHVPGLRVVSI